MRFRTMPHQIARLFSHDVESSRYYSSIFDICELDLLHHYSVSRVLVVDKNIICFDICGTLVAVSNRSHVPYRSTITRVNNILIMQRYIRALSIKKMLDTSSLM